MSKAEQKGLLHTVGVIPELEKFLLEQLSNKLIIEQFSNQDAVYSRFIDGYQPADLVMIGLLKEDPVQIAQRLHLFDKRIPIIIMASSSNCEQMKRTIMFSPFLGSEVFVRTRDDIDSLPNEIISAIKRRIQKTSYDIAIANTHVSFDKLPLLRPEATHYFDQLLENAPIGVMSIETDGTILTVNPQALRILGVSERNALETSFDQLFPDYEQERVNNFIAIEDSKVVNKGPIVFEINVIIRGICYVEITLSPLAYRTGKRSVMLILQDVTDRIDIERKRQLAVDELRAHTRLLRAFHEITINSDLSFKEKTQRVLALGSDYFGLPIAIFSQITDQDFFVKQSVTNCDKYLSNTTLKLSETYCQEVFQNNTPIAVDSIGDSDWQGHLCYRLTRLESYIGSTVLFNDKPYGTLCFLGQAPREQPFSPFDLETLKLMSQWVSSELDREAAEAYLLKLSGAMEQTANAVMITDKDRVIEYVNPAFEELTGYKRKDVMGEKTYFLRSGKQDKAFYEALWEQISTGGVYRGIIINKRKDGSLYHEQKTITPLKNAKGEITHFISTGHDISEIVKAQERDRQHKADLAHVARLSVMGEMTSSLAHELNQPLCAIMTYAQTCIRINESADVDPVELSYGLQQIVHQAELGGAIFKRLRNFARKGEFVKKRFDIGDIVNEVANFIQAEAKQNETKIIVNAPSKLPKVVADPIQIEQVMINLARNAMDAMAEVNTKPRLIQIDVKQVDKDMVSVYLKDTGSGCPPDLLKRLFEPFFTTKSNGLGIGLSISQNIIDEHGGSLYIASSSQEGTTFCFTLPTNGEST